MLGGTLALLATLTAGQLGDCVEEDEQGRQFLVCFDPGNGIELGLSAAERGGLTPALDAGLLLRTERESVSKEGTLWFNEHRILSARAEPSEDRPLLEATLYQGVFRRHIAEGFILVPTPRPIRLPFPFDIAIAVTAGRYERRPFEGAGFTLETARAALLLDPVRSPTRRVHLSFGPAISHAVRYDGQEAAHELSPLTSGMVDLGLETEDGWWTLRLTGLAGWVFAPGAEGFFRARADAKVERLVLAVNDHPVSATARVSAALADAGVGRNTEWAASLGLTLRLFGR
ncbi:MAG: hypothetical protein HYZ28_25770 [Myxococcales bacterium]|nr:hypothetical protein [Myxococcales bacterium]